MAARTGFSGAALSGGLLAAGLGTAAALAWWALYRQQNLPMAEMWMPPVGTWRWTPADFGLAWAMWLIMMLAMMLPVATPMAVLVHRGGRAAGLRLPAFLAGYLLIWAGFGALATLLQWLFHGLNWLGPMMEPHSAAVSGTVLVLAGAYQFTPWKTACLNHCRTPMGFLLAHGRRGGWRLGLGHGMYCVGCCWAEMLVMFAVGLMNLLWMGLITLAVIAERYLPGWDAAVRRAVGLALIAWGCRQWLA